jgi:hypothetical protein
VLEPVATANARRLRKLLTQRLGAGAADNGADDDDRREAEALIGELIDSSWLGSSGLTEAPGPAAGLLPALIAARDDLRAGGGAAVEALVPLLAALEADPAARPQVEADYFVLALPLEQLAYHVNRTTMLTFLAPELREVLRLAHYMDWMAGVQFYLQSAIDIAPGHLVGLDSSWALTAIEQTQFWRDVPLPAGVKAVLSVDVAAWDQRGRTTRKEAFNCTDQEIAGEVWGQLKEMLNRDGRPQILRDDMLLGGSLERGRSYHLDESIVDLRDPKKQAFYERARGMRFCAPDLIKQGEERARGASEDSYVWGPRARFNAEPLLINRAGSRALRPEARTSIPNLFLAGDFIKTETDLACMEGANEAARLAVNGILEATASREPRCALWPFSPSRQIAATLTGLAGGWRGLQTAGAAVSQMKASLWRNLARQVGRVQGSFTRPDGDAEDQHLGGRR